MTLTLSLEHNFFANNVTHTNLWLSMYLVRSTLVLGSCTYVLDTSGTVITSTSFRPVSEENEKILIFAINSPDGNEA